MEVFSIIASSASIVIAFASVIFSLVTYRKTVTHDRKQATLDTYNRLQNEVLDNLNAYTPSEIADIAEEPRSAEYKKLSGYIARIEHFCVGINEKIYDDDTFYALAHGYFDGHQLKKRIEPLLKSKNRSNNTKQLYYQNIIAVLEWMKTKD